MFSLKILKILNCPTDLNYFHSRFLSDLSREEEEALRSLYCAKCDVELNDEDGMMAHIKVRSIISLESL